MKVCDLTVAINAHSAKSYNLGFDKNVTLSNLAKVNLNRYSKIFEKFAYHLKAITLKDRTNDDFQIKGQIYAFDSTNIYS